MPLTAASTTMLYSRKPDASREVRRRFALAREPVRPVGVPSEIVQQGPVMQLDRIAGLSARLDKARTADRKQILLVQRLLEQTLRARRSSLADVCDPDIEIASRRVDAAMVGLQLDDDTRVGQLEIREPAA